MEIAGKSALVTGASGGIGRALCTRLLKKAAKVCMCDVNQELGEELAERLGKEFGRERCFFSHCDVSNQEQFEECFREAVSRFGGLDIVVNNAAVMKESLSSWETTVDINFKGAVRGSLLGVKYMSTEKGCKGNGGGCVLNVASVSAFEPLPTFPVYAASKAAVLAFTRSIGVDYYVKRFGVRFVSVLPGWTDTGIFDNSEMLYPKEDMQSLNGDYAEAKICQDPENVVDCITKAIEEGETGSLWIAENCKPPRSLTVPDLLSPASSKETLGK